MTTPNNPGQLYTLDWESFSCGDTQAPPDWINESPNAQVPYRVACSPDPVRSRARSARFELNQTDPISSSSKRTELAAGSDPDDAERWYGFSIFLPQGWIVDTSPEVLTQWHQSYPIPDPLFDGSPPLALGINGQQWEISRRKWEDLAANDTVPIYTTPWEADRWTDWVFHVLWRSTTAGVIEVWKDGSTMPVFTQTGMQTKFPDNQGKLHEVRDLQMGLGRRSNRDVAARHLLRRTPDRRSDRQ
jgi:Polysaccharide lyase